MFLVYRQQKTHFGKFYNEFCIRWHGLMVSLKLYVSLICMKHGRTTLVFTNKIYTETNWYQNNRNENCQVNNYTPGHVPICKCLFFNRRVGVQAQIRRKWIQLLLDGSDWCSTSSIVSQRGSIASRRLYTMARPPST